MANTINKITTDFNTNPYNDDFDETKNFHRILFKPSLAVQARELTQLQTIAYNQLSRFEDHVLKAGSIVTGGQFIIDRDYNYVKLNDLNSDSLGVVLSDFLGKEIVGLTTGVKAKVYYVESGVQTDTNKKTLIFKYTANGSDGVTINFSPNEQIQTSDGFKATIFNDPEAVGKSFVFTIQEGVIYAKGANIRFPTSSVIVGKYTNEPTKAVGFIVNESIIDVNEDPSLLDPASGSTNFNAPGADRFKLDLTLTTFDVGNITSNDFILLLEVKDGITQEKFEKSQYSVIMDMLAGRTDDESGSYTVGGLGVRIREHLKVGDNQGLYTIAQGGNTSLLAVGVEPGKAYVKGYSVEKLVTSYVNTTKGLDYKNLEQAQVTANYGNYVDVTEYTGYFPIDGSVVQIRNAAQTRLTQKLGSSGAPSGSQIGTARVRAVQHISGTSGTPTAVYRIYLYDVTMTTGDFTSARSLYIDNSTFSDGYADIVLYSGSAYLTETTFNTLVYPIGNTSIRKLRDESDQIDTTFSFSKNFSIISMASGTFSVNTSSTSEIFPYGVGALNATQKSEIVFIPNANADTPSLTGTVGYTTGATGITGSGTQFTTQFNVGDLIVIAGSSNNPHRIAAITSDTAMTAAANITGTTGTGNAYQKRILAGTPIDFTKNGSTGTRTVTVTSETTANFSVGEDISVGGVILLRLNRREALEGKKLLRSDRYIHINIGSNTSGPINLGVSDIYALKEVRRKAGSNFTSLTEGTVVTNSFNLDNGQNDSYYDNGKLYLKPGMTLSANDRLLVKVDYFEPDYSQGIGYFTVDSYPIDDVNVSATTIRTEQIPIFVSPITSQAYDLRNCIDIRPVKTNVATTSTTLPAVANESSLYSSSFVSVLGQLYLTYPNQNFIFDYSYYMPRYDIITMTSEGLIKCIRGAPDSNPITPSVPDDSMQLARLFIAPYPSLSSSYASSINRNDLACSISRTAQKRYRMVDIGTLEKRIENLEYYTSLSLLEKKAVDMLIPDEDGLDRFKNGIFVDPFTSHALGDKKNPDYRIAIDPSAGELRPTFTSNIIEYDASNMNNVVRIGNLLALNHDEVVYTEQRYATNTRNAAGFLYSFKGVVKLSPESDYWTDTNTIPDLQVSVGATAESYSSLVNASGTVWNDWQTNWTGVTQVYDPLTNTMNTYANQTRSGTITNVSTSSQTQSIGSRVVDVALTQYMRARLIRVHAYGMKPNTKLHAFFDGENVSDYMYPANSSFNITGAIGDDIITDATGTVYALFYLPNNNTIRFRVGNKVFRLTNSFNNGMDAITSAEFTYSAMGLVQTTQNTLLTTVVPQTSTSSVSETRNILVSSTSLAPTTGFGNGNGPSPSDASERGGGDSGGAGGGGAEPIAQTFLIETTGNAQALHMKSIGLFFAEKDPNLGVTVQIRTVNSGSYIENTVVPYSEVYIPSSSILTSENGSVETKVSFPSLVTLLNGVEYAVVVLPEQNNPNTVVWTSRLGEKDLITGNMVTTQPHWGIFFVSANNRTWSPIQDEDLKFKLYRADYSNYTSGSVTLYNKPKEYVVLDSTQNVGLWDITGENVYGENRLTLSSITGGTIVVGQKVSGNTSGTVGTITNITGAVYRVKGTGLKNFQIGEPVTILTSGDVDTGIDAVITNSSLPTGVIEKFTVYDSVSTDAVITNSSGDFINGEFISSESGYISQILSANGFGRLEYSVIDFELSLIDFQLTTVNWDMKGTNVNNVIDSSPRAITYGNNTNIKAQRVINSRMLENSLMAGNRSLSHVGYLTTYTPFLSPIIDLSRTFSVLIGNDLNNDVTGETGKNGGNAWNKYISQKIALAEDQDAEDLKVYLSSYRPPSADIKVYAKVIHAEDSDTFDDKNWFEMPISSSAPVSSIENENDFREYTYSIPSSMLTGTNGEIQYTKNSITFTGYKYFQIKVVLIGTNAGVPPRVTDLRAIALQK